MKTKNKIGSYLQRQRKSKKLSIREVCRRAGINAATLSRIEAQTQIPGMVTAMKLSNVLGLDINKLVKFTTQAAKRRS